MSQSLLQRIYQLIHDEFNKGEGAWLVWCDPHGEWRPLLQRIARAEGMKSFSLIMVEEQIAGEVGSPLWRRRLQERIDAKETFVLHVTAAREALGWLWAQALRAERIYDLSLRQQLMTWGWRPQNINTSDKELALLAQRNLQRDPLEWSGGGFQPEPELLLDILAGGSLLQSVRFHMPELVVDEADSSIVDLASEQAEREEASRPLLDLTIEEAGLPPLEEQHLERWRLYTLVYLLVTHTHRLAPERISHHEYLIAPERRKFALSLLDRWLDSVRLSKGLAERILEADRVVALGNYMSDATLDEGPFLSYTAERTIFAQTCQDLAQKSGRELMEALASRCDLFEYHAQGFWGDKSAKSHRQAIPWGELARLSRAVQLLLHASPTGTWANYTEMLNWYIKTGWQVDKAGEEIVRFVSGPTKELLNLLTPLRDAYRNRWKTYMDDWSDLWAKAGCPVPDLHSQGSWLKKQLLRETRPTAVFVVDALRYDLGASLRDQINQREGMERAQLFPARTALPSMTALGMGMALPIDEHELSADLANGKWQLLQGKQTLNLSVAENRREWLRTHSKVAPEMLLSIHDIDAGQLPVPYGKRSLLFIFDDLIDKLGHDEDLELQGTWEVQQRYLTIIERVQNKGWLRILIVTDHGFIHWPGSVEYRFSPPLPNAAYSSRRAMAYPESIALEGPQGLAPGGKWRIAVPSGPACFRSFGGLEYFHGGASLQEWIVPCLKIEWPLTGRPVNVIIRPIKQILSLRPKIILEVKSEELFASSDVFARQIELRIRDMKRKTILFHSAPQIITPDPHQEPIAIPLELLEDVEAERGTVLNIELRDTRTDEIIDSQTTTLMIPIENW